MTDLYGKRWRYNPAARGYSNSRLPDAPLGVNIFEWINETCERLRQEQRQQEEEPVKKSLGKEF